MNFYVRIVYKQHKEKKYAMAKEFVDPGFPTDRTLYAPNSRHQKVHDGSTKAMASNQMQTFTLVSHKARNHQNLPKFTIHH
ncbi:hypothetical protein E4U14_003357 [Claviceps sp. LM454 group G7]|nr:hypothetical protein E4U14_003357 [Claviceps sp. LM454 group G7]